MAARYPAPGRMVDVGGYRLHLNCQGDHQGHHGPTVVMEAAEFSSSWAAVQPEVARFARVCTYDRAGLGWSDRGPNPRTAANIVEELHQLLRRASVEPPYVLVGHSKGGMFARLYAHQYPDDVVGMVLVDAAHEAQELQFPAEITRRNQKGRQQMVQLLGLVRRLNSIGLLTPILAGNADRLLGAIPEEARESSLAVALSDRFLETTIEETKALDEHFAEVRAAQITTLGEIPLIVLTAVDQFAALERSLPPDVVERLAAVTQELQTELCALSPRGKQVPVKGSSHHIQVDRPQVVIDAIREVVEAAQDRVFALFEEHAQNARPVLERHYGQRLAGALLEEAREQVEQLLPQIPDIGGDDNPMTHHLRRATTSLALYRAMKAHGKTAEETGRILYEAVVDAVGALPFSPAGPPAPEFIRQRKEEARRSQERRYPGDWVWAFVEGDGQGFDYGYDFYECGVQKYYRAQGADELLPYFCFLDFVTTRASGRVLMRTGTLAEGADRCDFRFRSAGQDDEWPPPFPPEPSSRPDTASRS
ncbi:MAG: alpha/beta fold hydrolase [Anaerolineae bacterium]